MSWSKICQPKSCGGLGIPNLDIWNLVVVCKLAWHISSMQESLWVKWVYEVYTKGADWMLFNPPITASWVLKRLCSVKLQLSEWMCKQKYQIHEVYTHHLDTSPRVRWDKFVWNRAYIPRERYIMWLAMSKSLRTRDKLVQMGVINENVCPMCNVAPEPIDHFFFQCAFNM